MSVEADTASRSGNPAQNSKPCAGCNVVGRRTQPDLSSLAAGMVSAGGHHRPVPYEFDAKDTEILSTEGWRLEVSEQKCPLVPLMNRQSWRRRHWVVGNIKLSRGGLATGTLL